MTKTTQLYQSVTAGALTATIESTRAATTPAGTEAHSTVQIVGNSAWEALSLGDCTAPIEVAYKNESSTAGQYIMVALANDDSQKFARIYPGEVGKFTLETATTYVKAAAGTPSLSIVANEI